MFFFFFKQKTAYEIVCGDWSSDVCSSDLVCACSTCHCIVREGLEAISEMSEAEDEELSFAPGLTPNSRLSCQSVPNGIRNLVVEIPNWNRNAVREGH